MQKRRTAFRFSGVAATTDRVIVRGQTIQFTEEDLQELATRSIGNPLLHEHRGRPIGKVEKAWVKDGKLYVEGVIYEANDDEERKIVEDMRSGKHFGFSLGYSYPPRPPPRVVLHGEITDTTEKDGKVYFEFRIPYEEVEKKLGSLEAISGFKPNRVFLHDGSKEAKERAEKDYLEGKEEK